jgi:hypothetical protein
VPDSLRRALTRPYAAVAFTALFALACLLMLLLPLDELKRWTSEEGLFEQASWVVYFVVAAICLFLVRHDARLYATSAVVVLAMGARELDLHRRFTTDSILKSRYYLKVQAPLVEKLLAGAVVLALTAVVLYMLVRYLPLFLRRLRSRSPAAITLATSFLVLMLTKIADRLPDVMRHDFGAVVPGWLLHLQAVFEEPLESTIPLLFLLAIVQARLAAPRVSRGASAA